MRGVAGVRWWAWRWRVGGVAGGRSGKSQVACWLFLKLRTCYN